jgi:hypothetical protein
MQWVNDKTPRLRQNMVNAGVPNFGVNYNTTFGTGFSVGENPAYYPGYENKIVDGQRNISNQIAGFSGMGANTDSPIFGNGDIINQQFVGESPMAYGVATHGGGIPLTGDKFYTESGQLLWNTEMEGEPNRVFIIQEDKMKSYNASMHLYAGWVNPAAQQLAYSRKVGAEVNTIIMGDALFIYPQRSWKDIAAAFHFMGEGFAAGYAGGRVQMMNIKGWQGLQNHYNMLPGAEIYWSNYYSVKNFTPWWR